MPARKPRTKKGKRAAVGMVMGEFKRGKLHSGSPHGPMVTDPDQAVAIAMHEAGMGKRKKRRGAPKRMDMHDDEMMSKRKGTKPRRKKKGT